MSDPALGGNAVVAVDFEQSWGTAKGSPAGRKIAVTSCGIVPTQALIDNPNIRGDFNSTDPATGKKAAQGPLNLVPTLEILPFLQKLLTGTLVKTGAAAASGSIQCIAKADMVDGETVTIGDGTHTVVFEFDVNGTGVGGGNTQVNISAATTAADVAAVLHAAINGITTGLTVTSTDAGAGLLTLVNDAIGIAGNVAITDTVTDVDFVVTGMTGGVADPYFATSKLGNTMPLSAIVETDFNIGGTHRYALASGVRINSWTIPISFEGFLAMQLDLMAKDVIIGSTAYDASLADWSDSSPLDHMQLAAADVKLGGAAVAYIRGGQVQISANLDGEDYRVGGAGARGSLVPRRHTISGNLELAVDSVAVVTLLGAGTPTSLSFKWTSSAGRTWELTLPRVFMEKTGPALQDDGIVKVNVNFRAVYDPTALTSVTMVASLGVDPDTEYV